MLLFFKDFRTFLMIENRKVNGWMDGWMAACLAGWLDGSFGELIIGDGIFKVG